MFGVELVYRGLIAGIARLTPFQSILPPISLCHHLSLPEPTNNNNI